MVAIRSGLMVLVVDVPIDGANGSRKRRNRGIWLRPWSLWAGLWKFSLRPYTQHRTCQPAVDWPFPDIETPNGPESVPLPPAQPTQYGQTKNTAYGATTL